MNSLIIFASLLAVAAASYGGGHYAAPYQLNGYSGGPQETYEVQAAKKAHFAAHAEANARGHGQGGYGGHGYAAPQAYNGYAHAAPQAYGGYAAPQAYNGYNGYAPQAYGGYAHGHSLPAAYGTTRLIDPVAIAQGAPLPSGDTHEVAAAKVAHFKAHAAAKAAAGGGYGGHGQY